MEIAIDSKQLEMTRTLLTLPLDDLLGRAEEAAKRHAHLPSIGASPIILTGACATKPHCRHCKWDHFKALKRESFVLDSGIDALVAQAHQIADNGVKRAFTATGWLGYRLPRRFVEAVATIHREEPRLALYGLFGALDRQSHVDLAEAGLVGMLTGLESPSERVYRGFRPGGDSLEDRLNSFGYCRDAGLKVWTGFLVGLGESADEVATGIEMLAAINPDSVSILPFEPHPDTEMAHWPRTDPERLIRANAAARIRLASVPYFFTDHTGGLEVDGLAWRLGMNGSYVTGR